jgi:cell division protein FtsQ
LQQVSAKAFASAIAIDPGRLPALIPVPRRRASAPLGRIWVLHRRAVLRFTMAALVIVGIGGIYGMRARLAETGDSLTQLGLRELAHSPLGISQISMSGLAVTDEREVLEALHITPETSMVNFDADAARAAIEALPSVASATVRKTYPNHLYISVVERVPVARWRLNGVTYAVDASGARITEDGDAFPNLPLVVGDDAGEDAMVMTRAMDAYPLLKKGLVALSRIGDRRWDMIYSSGARVQLPELGVAQALAQLSVLETKYQLLERDVELIDLRVPDIVAVQPSAAAQQQLAAIYKAEVAKNKVKFNQDADYSAPSH